MRGPAKLATYIGVGMILAGFAMIALGWDGAAGLSPSFIEGQFPYLLSGGIAGLGLVWAGAGVLLVQAQREIAAEDLAQTDRVVQGVRHTTAALRGGAPAPAQAVVTAPRRSASGTVTVVTPGAVADEPQAVGTAPGDADERWAPEESDEALVVVGRSSFHADSCHLVGNRDDLDMMRREDAVEVGLRPCRVCKP